MKAALEKDISPSGVEPENEFCLVLDHRLISSLAFKEVLFGCLQTCYHPVDGGGKASKLIVGEHLDLLIPVPVLLDLFYIIVQSVDPGYDEEVEKKDCHDEEYDRKDPQRYQQHAFAIDRLVIERPGAGHLNDQCRPTIDIVHDRQSSDLTVPYILDNGPLRAELLSIICLVPYTADIRSIIYQVHLKGLTL